MTQTSYRSRLRRVTGATAAIIVGTAGLSVPAFAQESTENGTNQESTEQATSSASFNIVNFSDFHGHLENAVCLDGAIQDVKAQNANTLVTSSGDNIGGSVFISSVNKDESTLKFVQALDVAASSVGNHEFDAGYADLVDRAINQYGIPYLGVNVDGADEISSTPYRLVEVDGKTVAFIGSVTQSTPEAVMPSGVAGLTFNDPVAAVNAVADQLKDGNADNGEADLVVSLFHEDAVIAQGLGVSVDVVFAGHTHVVIEGDQMTAGGAPIIQSGQYGENLAGVTVDINETGGISLTPYVLPTSDANGECIYPNATEEVRQIVADAEAIADEVGAEVIGEMAEGEGLYRGQNATVKDGQPATAENRGTESSLGNYIGDAFLWKANEVGLAADFGMTNSGGIRADIPGPEVTYADAASVMPFGNVLGTKDLTAAQVYQMLEEQWNQDQSVSRPLLRLGLSENVQYVYDQDAAWGERVSAVWINGEYVDPASDRTYRVATNTFLLEGGDGFNSLGEAVNFLDSGYVDVNAFIDYIKYDNSQGPIAAPTQQRSWSVDVGIVSESRGYVDISSAAYTHPGDIKPDFADIYVGGELVGTAWLDTTMPSVALDEAGTGYVEFDVNQFEPGTYPLDIRTYYGEQYSLASITLEIEVPEIVTDEPVETPPAEGEGDEPVVTPPADDGGAEDEAVEQDQAQVEKDPQPAGSLAKAGAELGYLFAGLALFLMIGGALVAYSRQDKSAEETV